MASRGTLSARVDRIDSAQLAAEGMLHGSLRLQTSRHSFESFRFTYREDVLQIHAHCDIW